jgi:type I restriction enzyme, S subunit
MSAYRKQLLASALTRILEPVEIDPYKTYRQVTVRLFHKGVVLRGQKVGSAIRTTRQWQVHQGQVLLSRIDARNGAIGIVPPDLDGAIVTNDFWAFSVNSEIAVPAFLDAYFGTAEFVDACNAASEGTTNRIRLQPERFLEVEIPLPPLDEQRRVVCRIEALTARVEDARILRSESTSRLNALIKSYLATIFHGLAARYGLQYLGDLITEANYGTSKKCDRARPSDAVPVLRIPNVASELVNLDNLKYAVLTDSELRQARVREGDILVVRTNGSADLVGRCAVVPSLPEPTAFASYLIRLRAAREQTHADYLQLMLKHLRTNGSLIDFARTTAGQYNVSLGRLRTAQIPVPPLQEQSKIVSQVRTLETGAAPLRSLQAQTAAELDALMPSILSRAFRGEL